MNTILGNFSEANGDVEPYDFLDKAELERFAILSEESAEVQQIIGKIIRHGTASYNPFDEKKTPNIRLLEKEIGDFMFAVDLLVSYYNLNMNYIEECRKAAPEKKQKYLHYNTCKPTNP